MEGHAAVPHRGNLERVRPEIARLVEENEAEPAANHNAERDPEQKIVGLADGHRRLAVPQIRPRQEIAPVQPAEQNAGHIGEPVPADGERSDGERDRIDDGVGNDEERHGTPRCGGRAWTLHRQTLPVKATWRASRRLTLDRSATPTP